MQNVAVQILERLSNENADVSDVMNSNRNFHVSFDETLLSHNTNLNALMLLQSSFSLTKRSMMLIAQRLFLIYFSGKMRLKFSTNS